MPNDNALASTGFYFALPRLLAKWRGRPMEQTEGNWPEANIVGTLTHLIAYLFAFQILLLRLPVKTQLLLFIPLAFCVWVFWLLVLYFNSLLLKCLHAGGLFRATPNRHAQSLFISLITTGFACRLGLSESWPRWIGLFWLVTVAVNFLAALLLSPGDGAHPTAS